MTVYGASKLAGEAYTRAFWQTYHYPTVVLRPFNAYGPRCHHEGDSGEVIPKFLLRCLAGRPMVIFGDGTQTRDFTFVEDTAAGILAAGLSDASVGQTINLGSGKEIQVRELANTIAQVLARPDAEVTHVETRPGDVLRLLADSSKAKNLLRFESTVTLRDGLARLRDWYLSQGESPEKLSGAGSRPELGASGRARPCLKNLFQWRDRISGRKKFQRQRGQFFQAGSLRAPRLQPLSGSSPLLWMRRTLVRSPAAPPPFIWRSSPLAWVRAMKSSPSATPTLPLPTAFGIAGLGRSSWILIREPSTWIRNKSSPRSARERKRFFACTRWECRAT